MFSHTGWQCVEDLRLFHGQERGVALEAAGEWSQAAGKIEAGEDFGELRIRLLRIYEPLAKLTLQGDFSLLWAKAGGAGGHFWHDTVTETNIITPAKWILPNAN